MNKTDTPIGACAGTNRYGLKCNSHAQRKSQYCFFHDPTKGTERRMAQSKGGRQASSAVKLRDLEIRMTALEKRFNLMRTKAKS